jgi:hypothetical protein
MYGEVTLEEKEISESNLAYLKLIDDIYEVSAKCSIKTYIWGGLTTDIFEGRFLREHGDLDGFIENMMSKLEHLMMEYENIGYSTEFLNELNMLLIRKGNHHAAFNALDFDGSVAMWRHIGEQGTVYFPASWLDSAPRNFYATKVYTSGLCFEYSLRKIMGDLNPEWKEREKDKLAKAYLEAKIIDQGLDSKFLLKCIWSYNPFWIKKGYSPFDKPTLICPTYTD